LAGEANTRSRRADWLRLTGEQRGLRRYVETIRDRIWILIVAVIVTSGAAIAYVLTTDKVYEAEADVLVTPVPDEAEILASLGLIRESVDPLRDVETAARLITNIGVAERVREELGTEKSAEGLLEDVSAEPVAESNIVAVTAKGPSPDSAATLANTFAGEAIERRTESLHAQIDAELPQLEGRLSETELGQLEVLRAGPDPTLQLETEATPRDSPVEPRPVLSLAAGILAGLVVGVSAAFAFEALDPKLRREEQLRASFGLPILARIPREPGRRKDVPLAPGMLSPVSAEAYRTLRATLGASRTRHERPRSVLVTGTSASEGKTTTAINLATAVALAGRSVILIEADLRRPAIGRALGVRASPGVVSVLIEEANLNEALVTTPSLGPSLRFLLADHPATWVSEVFSLPAGETLIEEAKRFADFVVIDSPPLAEVVDAMPLARQVDDVLLVVRIGTTRLNRIVELGELLAENGVTPVGFAVLGVPRRERESYAYYHSPHAEREQRRALAEVRGDQDQAVADRAAR
jgi:capsular exopolysaccharide synthesis family protein